ncbi:Hypp1768 [Branchiostoma lanceolatum]|uniref:Hypp1768 protein n=2 Tax=Branchiostoma lanceolatum TaxID=7740 RepID=A0A8J9ZKA1_BRALA|nr:Hypp1768 [Branchiostoma lanceolatum]
MMFGFLFCGPFKYRGQFQPFHSAKQHPPERRQREATLASKTTLLLTKVRQQVKTTTMRCGLSWLLLLLTYTLVLLAVTALPTGDSTLARDRRALGDQGFTSDLASKLSEAEARRMIQNLMAQAIGKRFSPAAQEELQASKRQLGDQGVTSALASRLEQAEARQYIKDLLEQAVGKRSGGVAKRSAAEGVASRKRRALTDQGLVDQPPIGREESEARKLLMAILTTRAMTEGDMYSQSQQKWRRDPVAEFLDRLYEQEDF